MNVNSWWRTQTFKNELRQFALVVVLFSFSAITLGPMLVDILLGWRSTLLFGLLDGLGTLFMVDGTFVLLTLFGTFVGMVILVALDQFKYLYGYTLLGATLLAIIWISSNPRVLPLDEWNFGTAVTPVLAGTAMGLAVGDVRMKRRFDLNSLTHGFLEGSPYEFRRALGRIVVLVTALLVLGFLETIVGTVDLATGTFELDVLGAGPPAVGIIVFGVVVYKVRSYTADTNTFILGPTGSGKTTMMAGTAYTGDSLEFNVDPEPPLEVLETRFVGGGFDAIDSTAQDVTIPIELRYKHGLLFPKRVTVRAVDYAGDHLEDITVPDESDVVTSSYDEAFRIAEAIRWKRDKRSSDAGAPNFFDQDPTPEGFDYGDDYDWAAYIDGYDGTGEPNDDDIVLQVIEDMIYYADSLGLNLPLDDFAGAIVDRNNHPEYISTEPDGSIEQIRPRTVTVGQYLMLYSRLHNEFADHETQETEFYYAFTFADIAIRDYEDKYKKSPEVDPGEFTDHIALDVLPDRHRRKLGGMWPEGSSGEYNPDNAVAIYFDIPDEPGDPELEDANEPYLNGTADLLERMGR